MWLYGLHERATTWVPTAELYILTWAHSVGLYELINRQNHLHIDAYLPSVSNGLKIRQLVVGQACAKLRDRGQIDASPSIWHWLCDIDKLPDSAVVFFYANLMSLARFLFWTISHHVLVHCKWSVPYPRPECHHSDAPQQRLSWRIDVKPTSDVFHVNSRPCSSHNPTKTGN